MSDLAVARRFACRSCKRVHRAWAPRCSGCLSLEGLTPVTDEIATSPVKDAEQRALSIAAELETRPRLVVARAPSPEPELEDPVEELTDSGEDGLMAPIPLDEVPESSFVRYETGLAPLDAVLGGGLVVASVVLLAALPGTGKSSLTLQMLDGLGHRCLYVTGEETREQVAATARRIGAASSKIFVVAERNLDKIFAHARAVRAQTIAIDSIQKMYCEDLDSRPGTPGQLKECTSRLVQYAKETGTALWLIGHVTGDGAVAGPKTIEHDVDVVLELEQGNGRQRILRCIGKNRFGDTSVVGHFEITAAGFVCVDGDGWDEEL